MTQAIFLSYACHDADAARRICEASRAAGLEVCFDQSELTGGDDQNAVAVAAVADALSVRAGVVIEHTMAPGLAEKIASVKQNIPARDLAALVSRASTQTTAADVLAMVEAI